MTVTKVELTDLIQEKTGRPQRESRQLLELILEEIKLSLEAGDPVKIAGFGKWSVREKKPRPGRNPATGEVIEIAARKVVGFNPSDQLRSSVNGASARQEHIKEAQHSRC